MNIIILLAIYIVACYLYYQNASIHRKLLFNNKSPSNFNVLLSGVDHQKVTGQMIKDYFKNQEERIEIKDILYTHKVEKYIKKLSLKTML